MKKAALENKFSKKANLTASYTVNTSKTTTLYFTYDKNYYLLIDGLVKISTSVYNAEFSWTVDKGAHDAGHTVS